MTSRFLVIDKPAGITSHDVVAMVRAVTGIKKVGHTGTLDPFATGVLALGLGGATRLMQFLDESVKVYDANILLGTEMDTGDPTGEPIRTAEVPQMPLERVQELVAAFAGEQMQKPPPYSAVKVNGKPLYYYARKGIEVEVKARPIIIYHLEVTNWEPPELRVMIRCGRGTYARVLAVDIANAMGSAGHLGALSRHRSGPFYLEDALSIPELARIVSGTDLPWEKVLRGARGEERVPWRHLDEVWADLQPWLRKPIHMLSHLPLTDLDGPGAARVRNGGAVDDVPFGVGLGERFLVAHGEDVVAVAERDRVGTKVLRVLPPG